MPNFNFLAQADAELWPLICVSRILIKNSLFRGHFGVKKLEIWKNEKKA